jgi:predicted transcriptional regulator
LPRERSFLLVAALLAASGVASAQAGDAADLVWLDHVDAPAVEIDLAPLAHAAGSVGAAEAAVAAESAVCAGQAAVGARCGEPVGADLRWLFDELPLQPVDVIVPSPGLGPLPWMLMLDAAVSMENVGPTPLMPFAAGPLPDEWVNAWGVTFLDEAFTDGEPIHLTVHPQTAAAPVREALRFSLASPEGGAWQLLREAAGAAEGSPAAPVGDAVPMHVRLAPSLDNPVPRPSVDEPAVGDVAVHPRGPPPSPGVDAPAVASSAERTVRALGGDLLGGPGAGVAPWAPTLVAPMDDAPFGATVPDAARSGGDDGALLSTHQAEVQAWGSDGVAAASLLVGAGLLAPVWALYRRVLQDRALEQPQRKAIYDLIVASPGLTAGDLRRATGLHYTSCEHHVRVLQQLGFIEARRLGGQTYCFENHQRYGALEARLLAAARSVNARALLRAVLRHPGAAPAEVARAVGMGRSGAKRQLDKLTEWGLIEAERAGGRVQLRVAPGAMDALVGLLAR